MPHDTPPAEASPPLPSGWEREEYTRDETRAVMFMKIGRGCSRCCPDRACRRARLCLRYYEGCLMLPKTGVDAAITKEKLWEHLRRMPIPAPPDAGVLAAVRRAKRPLVDDLRREAAAD